MSQKKMICVKDAVNDQVLFLIALKHYGDVSKCNIIQQQIQ